MTEPSYGTYPGVVEGSLTHPVTEVQHVHAHDAHGGPDLDADGVHSHSHFHSGDNDHAHDHPSVLEDSVFEDAGQAGEGTPASSSGRDTSPQRRRAYLDSLNDRGLPLPRSESGGFLARISEAEALVEATEADWHQARGELFAARSAAPDQAHERSLNPQQRHEWVVYQTALDAEARAERAYTAARSKLAAMLETYEQISRVDLGFERPPDDVPGLSLLDRDRRP